MTSNGLDVYVYDAIRLPRARVRKTGGTLADVPAHALLAQLLRALARRGTDPAVIDDIVIGVSSAVGEHAAVGRTAAILAGWPDETPAGVVSRLCCSGLDAIGTAAAKVAAGTAQLTVAGGVESMSRVPMASDRPAFALDDELAAATGFVTIGVSADATAVEHQIARERLDEYAVLSHTRSLAAPDSSRVIAATDADGAVRLTRDEGARDWDLDQVAALPALFGEDPGWEHVATRLGLQPPELGLHTAGTAPQMCDGASAAVLGSAAAGERYGLTPIGRIRAATQAASRSPRLDSVVKAGRLAVEQAGLTLADIDLAEINESFAVTPLLAADAWGLPLDRVNRNGGAIAVGHPLGASGGILLVNALDELERTAGRFAVLAIPAALGLSSALVVERL